MAEENKLVSIRREKLNILRQQGVAYNNNFKPLNEVALLHELYDNKTKEELSILAAKISVAGRIIATRMMGKASFISLLDDDTEIQIYIQKDNIGENNYINFKTDDIGDIVGVVGEIFKTNKNELSIRAESYQLLSKSLHPLPEKFHGLTDTEQKYRQRYVDLIINEKTRQTFKNRVKIINGIRNYFNNLDFMEVETPMMHTQPGGATACAFETHHNAMNMPLYLRIAPELFLKRLIIGGFNRVYEINRSFRNEGVSKKHNPEFTMIEFYQAYATYEDLITLTEDLLKNLCQLVHNKLQFINNNIKYDFSKKFARKTLKQIIKEYNPKLENINNFDNVLSYVKSIGIRPEKNWGLGKLQFEIFEKTVEDNLIQPIFITEYPTEVSPLARKNDKNPDITDRFEFFAGGVEIANGFSELNDPEDQARRFMAQVANKKAGDDEAMSYDKDYITALEYGMPPTAGEGIGIDRLVMLLTDQQTIKDVILFPHMKNQNSI
ncbi:MAG: lysine--tRNA ligase [Gammaproteobacteria bacterium]|nr:MAG: lysine--tRNA ligase [Gammaproteobacteria bacterium]